MRTPPPNTYAARAQNLKRLGFTSYPEYLDSELWRDIRKRVLEKAGWRCFCCDGPASQVHHNSYDEGTLLGTTLKRLIAVCGECHKGFEFSGKDQRKLSVRKASAKAARIRKRRLKQERREAEWKAMKERELKSAAFRKATAAHLELDRRFDRLCRD